MHINLYMMDKNNRGSHRKSQIWGVSVRGLSEEVYPELVQLKQTQRRPSSSTTIRKIYLYYRKQNKNGRSSWRLNGGYSPPCPFCSPPVLPPFDRRRWAWCSPGWSWGTWNGCRHLDGDDGKHGAYFPPSSWWPLSPKLKWLALTKINFSVDNFGMTSVTWM